MRMDRKMMGGEDCASGLPGSCGAVKRVTWTENLRAARHIWTVYRYHSALWWLGRSLMTHCSLWVVRPSVYPELINICKRENERQ